MENVNERLTKIQDVKISQFEKSGSDLFRFKSIFLLSITLLISLFWGFDYSEYYKKKIGASSFQSWLNNEYKGKDYLSNVGYSAFKSKSESLRNLILELPEVQAAIKTKKFFGLYYLYQYLVYNYYKIDFINLDEYDRESEEILKKCHGKMVTKTEGCGYGKNFILSNTFRGSPELVAIYNDSAMIVDTLFARAQGYIDAQKRRFSQAFQLWKTYNDRRFDMGLTIDQFIELKDEDFRKWEYAVKNIELDPYTLENSVPKNPNSNVVDFITLDRVVSYVSQYLIGYNEKKTKEEKRASILSVEIELPIFLILLTAPFLVVFSCILFISLMKFRISQLIQITLLDDELGDKRAFVSTYAKPQLAEIIRPGKNIFHHLLKYYPFVYSDLFFLAISLFLFLIILTKWLNLLLVDVLTIPNDWKLLYSIGMILLLILTIAFSMLVSKRIFNFRDSKLS
jgi:hypothetical protein